MRHVTKNFCIITFSNSYKNIYDRSVVDGGMTKELSVDPQEIPLGPIT